MKYPFVDVYSFDKLSGSGMEPDKTIDILVVFRIGPAVHLITSKTIKCTSYK